jgi:hypothetical protein
MFKRRGERSDKSLEHFGHNKFLFPPAVELYMVKAFNHLREIGQPKLLDEQG